MDNRVLMSDLLEKFSDCNMFSLTGSISDVVITGEDKVNAIEEIKKENKDYLYDHYNKLKEEYSFVSFEELYKEIENECFNFGNTQKQCYMDKYGFFNNSFICDHVGEDTKYSDPKGYFWNFYHSVGLNLDRELYIDDLMKKDNKLKPVDKIENNILKSNLVRYEILFHNHCTESGELMVNYYFNLNEDTKKWLLQFDSDFDLDGNLEDLAFYKNGKIMFSSCTHEQFNSILQ